MSAAIPIAVLDLLRADLDALKDRIDALTAEVAQLHRDSDTDDRTTTGGTGV